MIRCWVLWVICLLAVRSGLAQEADRPADGTGPDNQYYPVHDYRDELLVYDAPTQTYVPFLPELHSNLPAVSAFIDVESNRRYSLLLFCRQQAFLFINAALQRKLDAGRWHVLSVDSLYRVYRQPELFLTIYGLPGLAASTPERPGTESKYMLLGYPKSATRRPVVLRDDGLSVRPRPISAYGNFYTLGLLLLLAGGAFLFNFNQRAFLRFYDPRDLFTLRVREESFLINKPLSRISLLFVAFLSCMMAYLMVCIRGQQIDLFASQTLLPSGQRLPVLLLDFALISFVVFALLVGKYLFLYVIGSLYQLEKVTNVHYFKLMQSSLLFFTALIGLVAVGQKYITALGGWERYLLVPFVAFYVGRLVLLFLVISRQTSIKNLYIFSYLCIVELIPLIIGIRFAL